MLRGAVLEALSLEPADWGPRRGPEWLGIGFGAAGQVGPSHLSIHACVLDTGREAKGHLHQLLPVPSPSWPQAVASGSGAQNRHSHGGH